MIKEVKHFVHHLLFPRESNNHRSKVLHHDSLLLTIIFLLTGFIFLSSLQNNFPSILGISANISLEELLNVTNQKRQANGLPPLSMNGNLANAASMKAQDMFAKNYWAHISPDGTTPWYFIKTAGYEYLYAGENLARGFTTANEVVDAWMASPSHKANLLSPNYTEIGFAVAPGTLTGAETILVVQMFGTKYIAQQPTVPAPTATQVAAVVTTPTTIPSSPTQPTFIPQPTLQPAAIVTVIPSPLPTTASTVPVTPSEEGSAIVAAIQNQPLIDSKSVKRQSGLLILFFFLAILIIDAVIIERKKIVRLVSHNLDHIIFLTIILIAAIIIGRGLIL